VPREPQNCNSWWKALSIVLLTGLLSTLISAQATPSPDPTAQSDAWRAALAGNDKAPVKIIEFFDYQCPYCAAAIPALEEAIRSYPGKVQLILKNTPLAIHPDSMLAHQAALAAGEQGKYWEMYRILYANRQKLKLENLLDYARQLNLNVNRFQDRLQTSYYKPAIVKDMALADSLGVNATPTFFINNQKLVGTQSPERIRQAIASALHDPRSAGAALDPREQARAVLREIDLSHAPVRGNMDAPVTIVEFSDMQCPYCAAVTPTLRQLITQYPGQIKWIFKNFPLDFHPDSALAHRAILAAGEQGKFWEMHDLIFANQRAVKRDDLLQHAHSLGLDMERFRADLDSNRLERLVESDKSEGERLSVAGTPTFFINGKEYSGALSLAQFQAIVNKEMPAGSSDHARVQVSGNGSAITSGPTGAPITLLWFSDLQSELTLKATLQVRQLMNLHPGNIRLVFKNRPLETHPGAMRLHEAAMAANAQGKFWQMHDLIIANPHKDDEQTLLSYASRLGLDLKRFQTELENHTYRHTIQEDLDEANSLTVLGTPVFFINSARIDGLQPQATMERLISEQLANHIQASAGH
jgi:protein-disulfide isomerase